MRVLQGPRTQYIVALLVATLVTLCLFGVRAIRNSSLDYDYLAWNLFLAWLPFLLALALLRLLQTRLWSSGWAVLVSLLWLLFLPNSFYMISDFIHLQDIASVDVLYDTVMFMAFIYLGLTLGFSSLYLMHMEFKKRFAPRVSAGMVGAAILLASFAIYIGRDLRRNSWDVLTNPAGLLFDISDRLLHPSGYGQIIVTTLGFFALLASMYAVLWFGTRLIRQTT